MLSAASTVGLTTESAQHHDEPRIALGGDQSDTEEPFESAVQARGLGEAPPNVARRGDDREQHHDDTRTVAGDLPAGEGQQPSRDGQRALFARRERGARRGHEQKHEKGDHHATGDRTGSHIRAADHRGVIFDARAKGIDHGFHVGSGRLLQQVLQRR